MKKRLFLPLFLCLLLLTSCGKPETIRFGAAGIGGMYHSFASAYTGLVQDDLPDYTIDTKTTAGSAANLRLLSENYIQLGIAQNDLIYDAYHGTGDYDGTPLTGYSAIAALYPEVCQIIVRKDSGIQTIDDLQGKTVSIGEEESGTERNALQILSISGLTDSLITTVNLDYTEAAQQLQSGQIDAFFCTAGIRTTVIDELSKQCEIRLISLDEQCRDRLLTAYPFYTECIIPANTYTGQKEPVTTLSVQAVLLASDQLSADTVYQLTAELFQHAQELPYTISIDMDLTEESAVSNLSIPLHPGAEAYYQEHIPTNQN
ncbi:MAG: TAXI family TRAP transporter solute-binding subunit [Clostridium sp.]|nr:TAXI family TRAP transporter solute-binding subunit [Clostridium sp.]